MREFRILALDAALANTGYSIFRFRFGKNVSTGNGSQLKTEISFLTGGVIQTEAGLDTDTRLRIILTKFMSLIQHHSINFVVLEVPVVLYNNRFQKSEQLNAAIGSLIKVCACAYGIVGYCHSIDMFCRTVQASEWQKLKKEEKKRAKDISIEKANNILLFLKSNFKLTKTTGEHVADSINVAMHAMINMSSGKWAIPRDKEKQLTELLARSLRI